MVRRAVLGALVAAMLTLASLGRPAPAQATSTTEVLMIVGGIVAIYAVVVITGTSMVYGVDEQALDEALERADPAAADTVRFGCSGPDGRPALVCW
jgi:hypothetical protein